MTPRAALAGALLALSGALAAQKDLEAKVEQLGSADAATRSQAYTALIRERNPDVVPLLGKRIDTMPPDGQQYALYVLQQYPIDTTRALYTRLLGAERALLRATAAAMLVRSGDKKHQPLLTKAAAEAPASERFGVLNALWSIDDPALLDAVRAWLGADTSGPLATSVLAFLKQNEKTTSPATTAAVRALAKTGGMDARAAALVWLVGGADGEQFAAELVALLRDAPNRYWMVERLFDRDRKYPAALTPLFENALAGPRSQYDVTQTVALLRTQAPELVAPTLRKLLGHHVADVRTAAMQALAASGGLEAKELQKLLKEGTPEQQVVAAAVLRRMDDPSGLPIVLQLAQQPGNHLAEAVRVLATFRSREIIEPLLKALDDGNALVRQNAWTGVQQALRDLFPYRRFEFERTGYNANTGDRAAAIQMLRAWLGALK